MASSKVMASTSPANPDLPRQYSSSLHSLTDIHSDHSKNLMDDLLKNICNDSNHFPADHFSDAGKKTVDEVWKDIVTGTTSVGGTSSDQPPPITLEDFLTKAGAVREEDVKGVDDAMFPYPVGVAQGFGNGYDGRIVARGKRRAVEETVDKATQQKQRRMIKNRESAARSRERKQAYTVELESIVTQLEEENARLLQEEAEQTKERFKQLMQNLIPVVEKKRPPRVLRRVHSM